MPIMTSHLCAASVLRTKPGACGYQLYESPLPSLSASNSASLFSKPSPRSVENGMLCGSAQTLSTLGSTSSIDESERSTACASSFPTQECARDRRGRNAQAHPQPLAVGGTRHRSLLVELWVRRHAELAQLLCPRQLFSAWVAASG